MLHLNNAVIAQRHARSVILQNFFQDFTLTSNIFDTWGTVSDYITRNVSQRMRDHIGKHRAELTATLEKVVHTSLHGLISDWLDAVVDEVSAAVEGQPDTGKVYLIIMKNNLLPKYAFPIDVVTLTDSQSSESDNEEHTGSAMSRDLKQGISEYAPGAELPRQKDQVTILIKSVGLYDAFEKNPDYGSQGFISECRTCQAVQVHENPADDRPLECGRVRQYGSSDLRLFTAQKASRRTAHVSRPSPKRYESGEGMERSGYSTPARLYTGESSFATGQAFQDCVSASSLTSAPANWSSPTRVLTQTSLATTSVRSCGRSLDPEDTKAHCYPADIPPHRGRSRGPRAGQEMSPISPPTTPNQVILAHTFQSEVIFLGVALPPTMDATLR